MNIDTSATDQKFSILLLGLGMSREKAFEKFKEVRERYIARKDILFEANEAESRLLVIDEILNILGWNKEEFTPEAYCRTAGYADYILSTERTPRLVVEAKKIGVTFGLPKNTLTLNEYSVAYLKKAFNKKISEVIDQAQRYCINHKWCRVVCLPNAAKSR